MSTGERIKSSRKRKGLTQKELAKRVNVSPQVISNWEREYTTPDSDDVAKVADVLDVSTEFLLCRTNDPNGQIVKEPPAEYNTISEINKLVKKYGIEQFGFFDIEKWKELGPEEIDEIRRHFDWVLAKKKQLDKEKSN